MDDDAWDDYLAAFHAERPGITEAVLARATSAGDRDPYDWLVEALPGDGVVVDVACGNGPLATRIAGHWIGLDLNLAELSRAAQVAPGQVVLADATSTPLRAGEADAVVCSMALMLLDDPGAAMVELTRLLRAGGLFVALLPAVAPLSLRDRARYIRLLAALRLRRFPFRHPGVLDDPQPLLTDAGLRVVSDQRRRFVCPLTRPDDALRLAQSLYLPELPPHRLHAAERVTQRWTGAGIGIPLRRLVATTTHQPGASVPD